jgi:hypothetical protein
MAAVIPESKTARKKEESKHMDLKAGYTRT